MILNPHPDSETAISFIEPSARSGLDWTDAFSDMSTKGAGALVVLITPVFDIERQRIVNLGGKELAADGGFSEISSLLPIAKLPLEAAKLHLGPLAGDAISVVLTRPRRRGRC